MLHGVTKSWPISCVKLQQPKSWPKQFIIVITASSRPERDEKVVIYES